MQFEEFWQLYIDKGLVGNYPAIKEVFSHKISPDIEQEYDVEEILLAFVDRYSSAKEFENIIDFIAVLEAQNAKIFDEVRPYYDEFLIIYYCYHKDETALRKVVDRYIQDPLQDIDLLLKSLYMLIYSGYTQLGDYLIENAYKIIIGISDLNSAAYDLALLKHQIELGKVYKAYKHTQTFTWDTYKTTLEQYNFEFENKFLEIAEQGFTRGFNDIPQKFPDEFSIAREQSIERLEKTFMVYMNSCHIDFPTAGTIWNYHYEYWESQIKNKDAVDYFKLDEKTYKEFIRDLSGFIMDYRFLSVLVLWGGRYVYDFLREATLIEEEEYQKTSATIEKLKTALIKENKDSLWEYMFVQNWTPPKGKSEDDLDEEQALFKASYHEKPTGKFTGGFFTETKKERLERLNNLKSTRSDYRTYVPQETIKRTTPKIGRNEKVTVEYKDGTVKTGIKYKKVMKDIETGKCKIVS